MATGFLTDTTVCIGCKACEVACKQWNQLPADGYELSGDSYDNTGHLSGTTWRHVAFIENPKKRRLTGDVDLESAKAKTKNVISGYLLIKNTRYDMRSSSSRLTSQAGHSFPPQA